MSDYFKGVTFPWQEVTPSDDAIVRRAILPDRCLSGCKLSYSGYTLTMSAGVMIVCGRQFKHTATQNWAITGATSGFARLLLTIDVTKASTESAFEQIYVSIEYASAADGFSSLRQDDINSAGTVYQVALCVVELSSNGITKIVSQIIEKNNPVAIPEGGTGATTAVKALDKLKALNLDWITDGDYQISSGDDLNNYTVPGAYRCSSASITVSLVNATPYTGAGFRLIVTATSYDSNGVLQIAIFNTTTVRIFVRVLNHSGTWGSWNQITTDANIAPTTANVNSDLHTAWFAKIGTLVICTLLPRTTNNHAVYQSEITIPAAYRPASQAQFLIYSSNAYNAGGSQGNDAFGYITVNTNGTLRVSNTYGITVQESSRTVMWISA